MDDDEARESEGQAAQTRPPWERAGALRAPYELAQNELDLLYSQVPGHQWNAWGRLTGEEDYYAACSCGWRSTATAHVSPTLRRVKDHLDAVRAARGWRPTPRPGRDERELHAAVSNQQRRLAQALEHSTGLLSASEEQADRLVVALQHATANVASESSKNAASARRARVLHREAEHAKEVRGHIVAVAGALAAMAEEIALLDRETRLASPYLGLSCSCVILGIFGPQHRGIAHRNGVTALARAAQAMPHDRLAILKPPGLTAAVTATAAHIRPAPATTARWLGASSARRSGHSEC